MREEDQNLVVVSSVDNGGGVESGVDNGGGVGGGVDNGGVEVLVVVTVAKKLGRTW